MALLLGVALTATVLGGGGGVILWDRPGAPVRTAASKPEVSRAAVRPTASAWDTAQQHAAAQAERQVAAWIADQVDPSAIVACDPEMCSALQAQGLAASRLLVLRLTAPDPLGADIVVATSVVRSQYGDRLASVYAPLVIASFGTGPALIDIRAVAADGAAVFESHRAAELRARIAAGEQLLRNKHITVSGTARAELIDGRVDPRLLVVLAGLAAREQVRVIAFADPSPGADVPLRSAAIEAPSAAALRSAAAFLSAQRPPYQAALGHGTHYRLTIQFDAPSPMGLANGP